jgi:hypothetical protein
MAIAVGKGQVHEPPPVIVGPSPTTSQRELVALGDGLAEQRGFKAFAATDALDARNGFPQRLYFRAGTVVVVEYLSAGKEMSKAQKQWADEFTAIEARSNGAVRHLAVTPSDWNRLNEALS